MVVPLTGRADDGFVGVLTYINRSMWVPDLVRCPLPEGAVEEVYGRVFNPGDRKDFRLPGGQL